MTVQEALTKMHEVVDAARERLEGNGFTMTVTTVFMDSMFRILPDENKARYARVSLLINKEGGQEGEEYCLSIGAALLRNKANEARLMNDIELYQHLVDDTVETLAQYEDKNEGFAVLTKKAEEECEQYKEKILEQQKKARKSSMIFNVVLIGVFLIILFLMTRN